MAFAHSGMTWKTLCTENVSSDGAVTDVGFCAKTLDASSIATENADVVKHGGFFHKLAVGVQFGMVVNDG